MPDREKPEEFRHGVASGERMGALLLMMIEALALPEDVRQKAAAVVADSRAGLDEKALMKEWRNDLLVDRKTFDEVRKDPGSHYLAWIRERVLFPFHVTFRAVQRVQRSLGHETSNLMESRWSQEIAWAQRMRAGDDDRVAVMSHSFVKLALRDPGREFEALAHVYADAVQDVAYLKAEEHLHSAAQIRVQKLGKPAFGPLFFRRASLTYKDTFDRMPDQQLKALALAARRAEEQELVLLAGQRAARLSEQTPLSRLMSVIEVAAELGYGSDCLVAAEEAFRRALVSGEVKVPKTTGFPHAEFLQFLRTTPRPDLVHSKADRMGAEADLLHLVSETAAWLKALPGDYVASEGRSADVFKAWLTPLILRHREVPRDLVVDYGFFLQSRYAPAH